MISSCASTRGSRISRSAAEQLMFVAVLVMMASFHRFGSSAMMMSSTTQSSDAIRIFCFGDSLTAGTSPPEFATYPYAPHLEAALHDRGLKNVIVRHRGFPGWTSEQLVADLRAPHGLVTALAAASPVSIVILLAGTNDLGLVPDARNIIHNIKLLHQACWEHEVEHTIAIGIPSSGYQSMVPEAAQKAQTVNNALASSWSGSHAITFAPFPFGFAPNDDRWSPDGLHFSPNGYKILGESLAPIVEQILRDKR